VSSYFSGAKPPFTNPVCVMRMVVAILIPKMSGLRRRNEFKKQKGTLRRGRSTGAALGNCGGIRA